MFADLPIRLSERPLRGRSFVGKEAEEPGGSRKPHLSISLTLQGI
jgi:hypothetical protein